MSGWRLLAGGAACDIDLARWDACASRLGIWVPTEVDLAHGPTGAHYESDEPAAIASRIVRALDEGQVAVLASGPRPHSHHAGDATIGQIIGHLPDELRGCIIGSGCHGHLLGRLAFAHPGLRCLVGPPIVESLSGVCDSALTDEIARDLVSLWRDGPRDGVVAPRPCIIGHPGPLDDPLGRRPLPDPPYRCLHAGTASGRVLCGSAVPLALELARRPVVDDVVLFVEPATMAEAFLDTILAGPSGPRIAAVVLGLAPFPIDSVANHFAMARRILRGRGTVASVGGFAATGVPTPLLEIGRRATVAVSTDGVELVWSSDPGRTSDT